MTLFVFSNITNVWNKTDLFVVRFTVNNQTAVVHYTLDGSLPNDNSSIAVNNKVVISKQGITTVKYFARTISDISPIQTDFLKLDDITPKTTLSVGHQPEGANNWYTDPAHRPIITLSSIDVTSGVYKIYYRWNDATFQQYTVPFTIPSGQGVFNLQYYATDIAGNTEVINPAYFKFDINAPITVDDAPETLQKSPVTVDFFHSDNASGIAETFFTTDGTLPTTQSSSGTSVVLNQNGAIDPATGQIDPITITYFSVDQAGNQETPHSTEVLLNIDTTPPTANDIYISENIPIDGKFGWYKTAPLITLSAVDPYGISQINYKFTPTNGIVDAKFTGSVNLLPTISWDPITDHHISLAIDGYSTVEISFLNLQTITQVIDKINTALKSVIQQIRTVFPDASSIVATETTQDGNSGLGYITLTSPTTGLSNPASEIQFNTPTSGVDGVSELFGLEPTAYPYSFKQTGFFVQYVSPISLPNDGEWIIEFYAVDSSGLEGVHATKTYRQDRLNPISKLIIDPASPDSITGWYNHTIPQINFEIFDLASGGYKTYYQWNNGPFLEYSGSPIDVSQGISTLNYFSIDKAGNVEDLNSQVLKIDYEDPVTLDNTSLLQGVIYTNQVPGWSVVENELQHAITTLSVELNNVNVKAITSVDYSNNPAVLELTIYGIIYHQVTSISGPPDYNIITFTPAVNSMTNQLQISYTYNASHLPEYLDSDDAINQIGYGLAEPIYIPLAHDASVEFKLYPSDNASGVSETFLNVYTAIATTLGFIKETKIYGGQTTFYTLDTDGLFLFDYWSVDVAGNIESIRTSTPIKIAKNFPEISYQVDPPNGNFGWYRSPFNLDIFITTTDLITEVGQTLGQLPLPLYPNYLVSDYKIFAGFNDQFYLEDSSIQYIITVPSGLYTGTNLASILTSILNFYTSTSNYLVTFFNYRFQINNSNNAFNMLWLSGIGGNNSNSIAGTIGFDKTKDYVGNAGYLSDFYRVITSNRSNLLSNTGFFVQYAFGAQIDYSPVQHEQFSQRGSIGLYDEVNLAGPVPTVNDVVKLDYKFYITIKELRTGLDSAIFTDVRSINPIIDFDNFVFDLQNIPRAARYKISFSGPSAFYLANGDGTHQTIFQANDNNSIPDTDVPQKSSGIFTFSFRYDSTPPVVIDNIANLVGYQPSPFLVTFTHADNLSGVNAVYYTTDGSDPTIYSAQAQLINETTSIASITQSLTNAYVRYIAQDKAGNIDPVPHQSFYPINVDGDPPVTLISVSPIDGNKVWDLPTEKGWFITPPVVSLTSSDSLSGVSNIFYRYGGQLTFTTYTGPFTINLEDNIKVEYYAVDNAGNKEWLIPNVEYKNEILHIDRTPPQTVYELNLQDSDLTVSFALNDAISGAGTTFFCQSIPISLTSYTEQNSFTISESMLPITVYYYSIDAAGNVESPVNISTINPLVPPKIKEVYPIPNAQDVSTNSNIITYLDDNKFGIDITTVKITVKGFTFAVNVSSIINVRYTGTRHNVRLTILDNRFITKISGELDVSIDLMNSEVNTIIDLVDVLNGGKQYQGQTISNYYAEIVDTEYELNLSYNLNNVYDLLISTELDPVQHQATLSQYVPQNNPNFAFIKRGLGYLVFVTPDFKFTHRENAAVTIDCANTIGKSITTFSYSFNPSVVASVPVGDRNNLNEESLIFIKNIQNRLASNYVRSRSTNFYDHHKAMALEFSRLVAQLNLLNQDLKYDTIRSQYLYEKLGYLLTIEPSIKASKSDVQYQQLLLATLQTFLKGSLKSSIEAGAQLYSPFPVKLTELAFISDDLSKQFTVIVDYLINESRLIGIDYGLVIENLTNFFKILRPAHIYIQQRQIFTEAAGQIKINDQFSAMTIDGRKDGFTLENVELPEELYNWTMIIPGEALTENAGDKIGINSKSFILADEDLDVQNWGILGTNNGGLLATQQFEELLIEEITYDLSLNYLINISIDGNPSQLINLADGAPDPTTVPNYMVVQTINNQLGQQIALEQCTSGEEVLGAIILRVPMSVQFSDPGSNDATNSVFRLFDKGYNYSSPPFSFYYSNMLNEI